jgi:Protein of unknown function (DUF2795)
VNQAHAAELKTALVGLPLPAGQPELLEYAVQQHAEPPLLDALRSLSAEREYSSLDEVIEELLQVQPARDGAPGHEPKEESGAPPGGDAYTG